jgi:hypothetical protein
MERLSKNDLDSVGINLLPGVMGAALWVIEYLSTDSVGEFRVSDVSNYMVTKMGISTSRQAVHAALSNAVKKKFCHKSNRGYSIMKLGQDVLLNQMHKEKVVLIEPGKPFAAGMKLETIFSSMSGFIKISDPYVDIKTLDILYRCAGIGLAIRILTSQIKDETSFNHEISKLQHEGCDIEVRKVSTGTLHDRYIIDGKHFWLSGNSLNNIGKKESFIVALDGDIYTSMLNTFNSRWQSSISI